MIFSNTLKKMKLMIKYRYLQTNRIAGIPESKEDWAKRMLVESGHDRAECVTMDFEEFNEKHNKKSNK